MTQLTKLCEIFSANIDKAGNFLQTFLEVIGSYEELQHCYMPVSYTHLDVYKRQNFDNSNMNNFETHSTPSVYLESVFMKNK